jgi:hypothetical protein
MYILKPTLSPKWFVWSGSVTVLLAYKDSLDVVSPAYLASAPDLAHTYLPLVFGRLLRTAYRCGEPRLPGLRPRPGTHLPASGLW